MDELRFQKGDRVLFNVESYCTKTRNDVSKQWREKRRIIGTITYINEDGSANLRFDCSENGIDEWSANYATASSVQAGFIERLNCRICGGRLLYNKKFSRRFCPFCGGE